MSKCLIEKFIKIGTNQDFFQKVTSNPACHFPEHFWQQTA